MAEEKKATLFLKLRAESGYSSNESHKISTEQWAEIQFIIADGPERETMGAATDLLALLVESQTSIGGDWRERRDAIVSKLSS